MEGTASDTEQKTNQAAPEQISNCRVNTSTVSLKDEHTQPESPSQLSTAADSESDSTCTREHFHAQSEVATTAAERSCRVFFKTSTVQDEHTQPESPSKLSTAADSESGTRGAQSEVAMTAAGRSSVNTSTVKDEPESPSKMSTAADSESGTWEHSHAQSEVATTAAEPIVTGERKWSVSIASLVGAIPALLLGITLGYPSNALLDLTGEATELQPEYFFSDLMISLFVSLAPFGAIFGSPVGGLIADRWGRKCGMMFCGVPYLIGYLALSYAHFASTVSVFNAILLFGRFFAGFGMGWASAVCPVYTGELCSAKLRGIYGNVFPIFLTSGIVLNYALGAINNFRYYYISLVAVGIVAVFEVLMFWLPETPRWLLSRGYGEQAEHVLLWLRGKKVEIKNELNDMKESLKQNKSNLWKLFLKRSILTPFIYVVIIFAVQQGGGINAITPFAGTLFADAGVSDPRYATIYAVGGSGIVALIASIILIDFSGRKFLLVISGTGEILGLVMLGVHSVITRPSLCANSSMTDVTDTMDRVCNPQYQYLAIFGVIVFVLMFTVGYNSVPYVLISELLPLSVRGKASGIATSVGWICAALFTGFYLQFRDLVRPWFALWGLAALNVVTVLFILRFIPETKGKSLEELEGRFVKKTTVVETSI